MHMISYIHMYTYDTTIRRTTGPKLKEPVILLCMQYAVSSTQYAVCSDLYGEEAALTGLAGFEGNSRFGERNTGEA